MKILVLGHKGMVGHMVYKYLSAKGDCELITTDLRWSTEEFKTFVTDFWWNREGNYIINCIGAIHQKTNKFDVNIDLPIWLDDTIDYNFSSCKVIHPGTDFEMDSDEYGISKKKAAEYISKKGMVTKMIRTSIFGPELVSKSSMFEWFMNSENEVNGWTQYYWNGITTLQWSKICYNMIINWDSYEIINIPATNCISKYELLNLIKRIFKKRIIINKNSDVKANRCLTGTINVKDINKQLVELKKFYYDN